MNRLQRIRDTLDILGGSIFQECHDFAISRLNKNDFILLVDANDLATEDIVIEKNGEKYTVKNSSIAKYSDFYGLKLEDIINKLLNKKKSNVD